VGAGSRRDPSRKILTREGARRWREERTGAVVFTNGVFDVLHRGHVAYLARARAEGDALVVGVNTDASVRRLGKGPGRPVNAELESVDAVVLFDEDTPLELIRTLHPDVLAKGADYALDAIVGADLVTAAGGLVVRIPLEPGFSTSALLRKVNGGQT
jgi:rfaE bifunctional protein nucleotidyltransferase chain/domain